MPAKLIRKVRTLLNPKAEAAADAAAPAPEPSPAPAPLPPTPAPPVAGVAEVVAPPVPAAGPMPEPLRKAKEARAKRAEGDEWRPGQRREAAAESPEKGPRRPRRRKPAAEGSAPAEGAEAPRPQRPRRSRPPRDAGADSAKAPAPSADASAEEAGEGQGARPPRPRTRRPRREAEVGEGNSRRAAPSPRRGKGFSFPRPKSEHGEWSRDSYVVPEAEGKTRFTDLDLADELLHAVQELGYQYATPIQAGILPDLLKGRDGLGQAQTGTGKTAAFLLACFTRMLRKPLENPRNGSPRILIIAPTRELVLQIEEEAAILGKFTPFQTLPVYGGLDFEAQMEALRHNVVDLVVATPGRLIDFLRKKVIDLSNVETLVLDEADRMLDMGFIPDVKRIVYATPHKDKRQTLFFSATFTDEVRRLAESWTRDPVSVVIEPENVAADTVDQTVYIITDEEKFPLTVNLLRNFKPARCLIFANRRDSAQYLCDRLKDYEFTAALLTGAVPQAKRVKTLEQFKNGEIPIVVATDVAGRGIHVEEVSLVINFNLPEDAEDYVHRIGRTGRAGAEGKSVGFADEMDAMLIPDIEKYLGRELVCTHPDAEWLTIEPRDRVHHQTRRERERDEGGRGGGGGRRPQGRRPQGRGRGGPSGGSGRRGGGRGGPRR